MRLLVLLMVLLAAGNAFAERKIALLIGNAAYADGASALRNPPSDVVAMKQTLSGAGFEVHDYVNLDRVGMSKALTDFEDAASGADIGVVFYSGHGIEVNGRNYLIPVDAVLASDRDVKYEAIDMEDALQALSRVTKLKLVLLDACRDNPFAGKMKSSLTKGARSKGLARLDDLADDSNLLIGYATAPGQVAQDGEGRNSPFTTALVAHLVEPGVEVESAFRAVAKDVYTATGGEQRPFKMGSIFETVMLGPDKALPVIAEPVIDPCRDAASHWSQIRDQTVPSLMEDHLRLFGSCAFSSLAKARLAELRAEEEKAKAASLAAQQAAATAKVEPVPETADACRDAPADWSEIRALGSRARLEAHLQRFPDCAFASVAKAELASLEPVAVTPGTSDGTTTIIDVTPDESAASPAAADPELRQSLQAELKRVGCYAGTADGKWGPRSERALRDFNSHGKSTFDPATPTADTLSFVRAQAGRVCPLTCSVTQMLENGACIARTCPAGQTLTGRGQCVKTKENARNDEPARSERRKKRARPAAGDGGCFVFNGEKMCE